MCPNINRPEHKAENGVLGEVGDTWSNRPQLKEGLFVLTDPNARTGTRMGRGYVDDKALGAHGRDELNDNAERPLTFASDNKLALTNTF